jgi:hypothetical protein
MAVTIRDYIKKCEFVNSKMFNEQEKIILKNEAKITNLNKNQFTDGLGSDNRKLFNADRTFTGIYKPNNPNPAKISGELYDFFETGSFIKGLRVGFKNGIDKINIFSVGQGTGDKSIFFTGYTNLYGLDDVNAEILNFDIIYPQLMLFIKKHL